MAKQGKTKLADELVKQRIFRASDNKCYDVTSGVNIGDVNKNPQNYQHLLIQTNSQAS